MNQSLPIGTVLHNGRYKYRIEEVLGKGGFGITYRVSASIMVGNVPQMVAFALKEFFDDDICDRNAANHATLECLPSKREMVSKYVDDFLTEARRLSDLSGKSQHIVRVNESFRENETAYYVMEYLDGGNLQQLVLGQPRKRMAGHGPLSEREAINYLLPIMDAVELLHRERVLHLDIKPDNIMLMRDPIHGTVLPVLIDFGVTKHFDKNGNPTTKLRAKGGTAGYAPLEQFVDITHFMPEIDVYALGATLLFLLTGKNPPDALLLEDKNLPGLIPTGVSASVRDAIIGSMQKQRENRLPTVAAMRKVLMGQGRKEEQKRSQPKQQTPRSYATPASERQKKESPVQQAKQGGSGRATQPLRGKNETVNTKPFRETEIIQAPHFILKEKNSQHESGEVKDDKIIQQDSRLFGLTKLWLKILAYGFLGALLFREWLFSETFILIYITIVIVSLIVFSLAYIVEKENEKKILQGLISNMVYVQGGSFMMGAASKDNEAGREEKPCHRVTLSSFFIGKFEVTQQEWLAVMNKNPSEFDGLKHPVEMVSWNDCMEFMEKLNALTGKKFRLPTEAEWEFAARGGNMSQGYLYSGSNNIDDVAWYDGNSGDTTHDVGQKLPNELGLYDMTGNVEEWCNDRFAEYGSSPQTDPKGPVSGNQRVFRGGSWNESRKVCRNSSRKSYMAGRLGYNLGLRLALSE